MITKTKTFDCVKWVREIRDKNYDVYKNLSLNEFAKILSENGKKSELWEKLLSKK